MTNAFAVTRSFTHPPPVRPDRRTGRPRRAGAAEPRRRTPDALGAETGGAHLHLRQGRQAREPVGRDRPLHQRDLRPTAPRRRTETTVATTKLPDPCQEVGGVGYEYGIGKYEVTVEQYVAFLNTVDPFGRNQMDLYSEDESGAAWPKFGQIDYSALARAVSTAPRRRNGTTSPTASPTSSAPPASTTRSPTARCCRRRAPASEP